MIDRSVETKCRENLFDTGPLNSLDSVNQWAKVCVEYSSWPIRMHAVYVNLAFRVHFIRLSVHDTSVPGTTY